MVTANRPDLVRRAVRCFKNQTYPNRELIVVDDGEADLAPILADLPSDRVRYIKLERREENLLGRLRNISLEHVRGEYILQWDDDDWIHPDRIRRQVEVLEQGYDACSLYGSLVHLDTEEFFDHPYVGYLPNGWPGSIMHRRDDAARYPEMRKAEDSVYQQYWLGKRYYMLPAEDAYLHIRCFHGNNTWDRKHFLTKMRNRLPDLVSYGWHRYVRGDLFGHPRFRLNERAREAFEMYLNDSFDVGLFSRKASYSERSRVTSTT